MKIELIAALLPLCALCSCSGSDNQGAGADDRQQNILAEETQRVSISVAAESQFRQELSSNGKVSANRFADVYWNVEGSIARIAASNGRHVQKGDVIAELDAFKLKNALESESAALEQSKLQMQDVLIGQGLNPDSDQIPENVLKLAQVKSGYLQSLARYNSAKYDYESAVMTAPISGVVANLTDRESNLSSRSKPFCRIIDQNSLAVDFNILESEIAAVKMGDKVEIKAFSVPGKVWAGHISEINPFVESSGMIKARAVIDRPDGLCEGMNVSLIIGKQIGKMVAVPKSSVVYRSGRPVVFTAKAGYACWNYVELGVENSDNVAIVSGISAGDSVIVSGNTFLADHSVINY